MNETEQTGDPNQEYADGPKPSVSQWWHAKDKVGKVASIFAVGVCVYDLLFILGIFPKLGLYIMVQPHRGLNLGIAIILTFLLFSLSGKARKGQLPWYDILFLLMGAAACGYYFFFQDTVLYHMSIAETSILEIVLFFMLMVSLLEGGRRLLGWPMSIIAAFFIFHSFFGDIFPGILHSRGFSLQMLTSSYYLEQSGVFGLPVGVTTTVVIAFVIFSYFLLFSGGGKFFIDFALALMGSVRGGPAKAAIVASCLFGTLSGSTAANVVGTGSITIPLMKSIGYKPAFAGAVEAVASNGGQIMPPVMGAVAFVMAEMTGIPYISICFAALLPAILYYIGLFCQVDLEALKLGLKGIPRQQLPSVKEVLKGGWQYLFPILVIIVLLAVFRFAPEVCALAAIGSLILVTLFNKETRMYPNKILLALEGAGKSMPVVMLACGLAGFIIASVGITGIGSNLAINLVDIAGGNLLILLALTAITCFILGMGITSIPIYLMLSVLVCPALIKSGVPVVAAHLFIAYWGIISFITPPVAIAAFVAAGIAQANPMQTGWIAARLGIVTYIVPFMFVLSPALVMIGPPAEVVLATITSIIGCAILAVGIVGRMYLDVGTINIGQRILLILGALLLIIPGWVTDIIGVAIVVPIILGLLLNRKRRLGVL